MKNHQFFNQQLINVHVYVLLLLLLFFLWFIPLFTKKEKEKEDGIRKHLKYIFIYVNL